MSTKATSLVTIPDFVQTLSINSFIYLGSMLNLLGEYNLQFLRYMNVQRQAHIKFHREARKIEKGATFKLL